MLSTGKIIEGAFALVRTHPKALLIWALVSFAGQLLLTLTFGSTLSVVVPNPGGAPADPAQLFAGIGRLLAVEALFFLLLLLVWTAALRAAVRPEARAGGFLRIGMDELRMLGLALLFGIGFYLAFVAIMVAGVLIFAATATAADHLLGIALAGVVGVVGVAALVFLQVRLSLAGVLTLRRRHIAIGEAWRLSRGNFWALFLAYVLLSILVAIGQMIVSAIAFGALLPQMALAAADPADPAAAQARMAAMMARFGTLTPLSILTALCGAVLAALWIALMAGAAGTAMRLAIGTDHDELAEILA